METTLNSNKFSQHLQNIMERHDLSATALAEKLEVGRATISHLMSGRNKPSLDFVMKLVSTFPEVDINDLLFGAKKTTTLRDARVETLEQFQSQKDASMTEAEMFRPNPKRSDSTPNSLRKENQQKSIDSIVIFYNDGTFTNYNPNEPV